MKRIIILICSTFLIQAVLLAEGIESFGESMDELCQNPSSQKFEDFQKQAEELEAELCAEGNNIDLLAAVMIAKIVEKYSWPIHDDGRIGEMAQQILEGNTDLAKYVEDDDWVDPAKLDVWWISYFATGDEKYLDKLLKYAGEELPENDMDQMMVIGAATWSFKSNCEQNDSVRAYAKKCLNEPKYEHKKAYLKECAEHRTLKDIIRAKTNEDGSSSCFFDIELLDLFSDKIAIHAREYPPQFESDDERREIESELQAILEMLDIIQDSCGADPEYLIRKGFLHSMGHNLDFKGSADEAYATYKKLLELVPDHPQGNYLFGMFLSSTAKLQGESFKYLKRAAELGVDDAIYTLGLLSLFHGNEDEGVACLQEYADKYPDSRATMMLQAYKDGKLTLRKSD